ncbi:hypothetical protein UFOVP1087_9 [uncultured Caudovirales phage]|uniref:Uncharacterized protein n=1 Tax=uncultured Caudovirales phage TaxID=2100421 RepID=A0A6J5PJ72_9CAUD|nr:hypothetical protein UFOVP910_24 [uncultured Caudovirales phage]CAB4182516.1 hypothetical protein UFOVP1087_9 [uncultured Caudovirales phage]CAB5228262.1 hypothetical protein UFOVP1534_37 [uncultured Caudovirales phage]
MASTPKKKPTPKKTPKSITVNEGDLVLVTWMDACATVGWEDHRSAILKPAHCRSVGWVAKAADPDKMLILYADMAHEDKEDHDSNRRIAIPAGWITGITKVKA